MRCLAHRLRRTRSGDHGVAGALVTSVTLGTYGHLFPSPTEKLVDGLRARWEALET